MAKFVISRNKTNKRITKKGSSYIFRFRFVVPFNSTFGKNQSMEFGRVPENELDQVDFSLPAEPPANKNVLAGQPFTGAKVYVGCAKWGRQEWVGKIYPLKTREKDFLKHYIDHFNAIELNATHYKIVGAKGMRKWAEQANGKDFKFCPKLFEGITHRGNLKTKKFLTNEFLRGIAGFEEHLGPVLIQVSDRFSPKRKEELFDFLISLPRDLQFFMEVRHPAWFGKEKDRHDLFSFLHDHNMGAVITDTAGRRDSAHMQLSIPKVFVRYVGNSLHPTDYTRIDAWVQRMKYWLDNGLEELYFFMHMHDEAYSPELALYLVDKLNQVCGLNLQRPTFLNEKSK
jgi:uncharacterized protein YecE (DUF72 family)